MVTACNSGGSVSEGPSEGLRMLQKGSTGGAGESLGREDGIKSKETGCSALQVSLVQTSLAV